jgi:hypothetical protein
LDLRKVLLWLAIAALAVSLLLLFNFWAPEQYASMAAYAGLVLLLAGALCALFPFRFLGVQKRRTGVQVLAAGLVLTIAALMWPSPLVQVAAPSTRLDVIRPDYHFNERHIVRIHAPSAQVMEAVRKTTFGELPAYVALMRVRGAVMGKKVQDSSGIGQFKILDTMTDPDFGFLLLDQSEREIVMGMAGRPWADGRNANLTDATKYASFQEPGSVKVAFNLRVDDEGNGWSRITTETRIVGLDDSGRRTMARYWRMVVPGSGLIRRQWLDAIQNRAEGRSPSPTA